MPVDAERVNYEKPSFFEKFFELNAVMWRTNAGLTERHAYDSRPQHWPWLRRGIVRYLIILMTTAQRPNSYKELLGQGSQAGLSHR